MVSLNLILDGHKNNADTRFKLNLDRKHSHPTSCNK